MRRIAIYIKIQKIVYKNKKLDIRIFYKKNRYHFVSRWCENATMKKEKKEKQKHFSPLVRGEKRFFFNLKAKFCFPLAAKVVLDVNIKQPQSIYSY